MIHFSNNKDSIHSLVYPFISVLDEKDIDICVSSREEFTQNDIFELLNISEMEYRKNKDSVVIKYFFEKFERFTLDKRVYIIKYFLSFVTNLFQQGFGFVGIYGKHFGKIKKFANFFTPIIKCYII